MRAVLMKAKGLLEVENISDPEPAPGEALIEIERCGICGSDLVTLQSDRVKELPRVLGHEFVGRIREVNVAGEHAFVRGDLVVAEPISGCGTCRSCRMGFYNACRKRRILGVETDGTFAQFVRVPFHNLLKVPGGMPIEEAALVQPVAVAVHALRRTAFTAGCTAAVLGAGPIGALLALVARAAGGTTVVLTEPNPFRRALMEKMGFAAVDPTKGDPVSAALSFLSEGDDGFDVAMDAAGAPGTLEQATRMARVGGEVAPVASYREEPKLGIMTARRQEINFVSARAHTFDDFRAALALIASRQVDVRPLITDQIDLEGFPEAFGQLTSGGAMMKVLGTP